MTAAPDTLKAKDARWIDAQKMAAFLNIPSHETVVRAARAYTSGMTAMHPIIRRKLDAPTANKRKYEYRLDDPPAWPAERVEELLGETDVTRTDTAEKLGCANSTVERAISKDRYFALPTHDSLDALAASAEPVDQTVWAVCDVVCGRLVVDSTHDSRESAEQRVEGAAWNGDTCDVQIVTVDEPKPKSGTRLHEGEVQKVLQ